MKPDITVQVSQMETLMFFSLANLVQTDSVELKHFLKTVHDQPHHTQYILHTHTVSHTTHSTNCKPTLMCCASSC